MKIDFACFVIKLSTVWSSDAGQYNHERIWPGKTFMQAKGRFNTLVQNILAYILETRVYRQV